MAMKMEDGEDVKNQQQLFVAKMTEDNFKKKNKKGLEEKQKEISIAKMGEDNFLKKGNYEKK